MSKTFKINETTVYRDLVFLEKESKIKRTQKGAVSNTYSDKINGKALNLEVRDTINYDKKKNIGNFASTLIENGESIMIDGGTTTLLFASSLITKNKLMVITNTNTIGKLLKKDLKNRVIMTGGKLSANSSATTGPMAEEAISSFRVNKAIIGVCSISIDNGFFTNQEDEAIIKRAMINSSQEVIILADSSKINIDPYFNVCKFDKKITLVTDTEISENDKKSLEKNGVIVYTA